jgi:hypothetical protein
VETGVGAADAFADVASELILGGHWTRLASETG